MKDFRQVGRVAGRAGVAENPAGSPAAGQAVPAAARRLARAGRLVIASALVLLALGGWLMIAPPEALPAQARPFVPGMMLALGLLEFAVGSVLVIRSRNPANRS
ncbi:MAG: hypothetical protein KDH20_20095 [Rhodocyclaceae bacterium]|nr:hypothetical protein [Rhodocyclaceae bacterium]